MRATRVLQVAEQRLAHLSDLLPEGQVRSPLYFCCAP